MTIEGHTTHAVVAPGPHIVLTAEDGWSAIVVKRSTGRTVAEYEGANAAQDAARHAEELNMKEQTHE